MQLLLEFLYDGEGGQVVQIKLLVQVKHFIGHAFKY
jgi:hypothetical protein